MPPRKLPLERINEAEEAANQDDQETTKEFLVWMRQQMTDLVAKNEATNARLETLSAQYQTLQESRNQEAINTTPQASQALPEALRSTTIPQENHTAATLPSQSDTHKNSKFPKISYPVFDESGDPDWHVRRFKVIARTNGVTNTEDLQNIFGTTLQGNHINWYIDFETEHSQATWEEMEQSFLHKFRKLKTSSEVLRALGSITQEKSEPVDKFYDRFKQLADKLSQRPEEDYLCEWFKKGLLPWIQQGIVIRGVKTLQDILSAANDISRELGALNKIQAPLLPLPNVRIESRPALVPCSNCGKIHGGRCWYAGNQTRPEDNRRPRSTTAAVYPEEINVDVFQPGRSDACWECGSTNHRRRDCPQLHQRWAQYRSNPGNQGVQDNAKPPGNPRRGGVTLTEVHGTETTVSTISTAVVTTRSKGTPDEHVIEPRKPFAENHWDRLHRIRQDLQAGLESTNKDLPIQQILEDTNVTITLSKLLQLSPELQKYLQQASSPRGTEDPAVIEVNATTLDPDAAVIHLQLGNHELTNVLVDGGSGVNVMSNHLRQQLGLPSPKLAQFILRMANDAPVTPLGILSTVAITTHGVSTPATFVVIDMPDSSNFPVILGRPWLRDMNAIHDWSRNQIRIQRQGKTVIIPVDSCITRAKANQIRSKAGTNWVQGLSPKQEAMVFQANPDLISLAEIHLASMVADQEKLDIPPHFSQEIQETVAVQAIPANQALQNKVVTGWTHGAKDRVELVNLGTLENPRNIKINADAPDHVKKAAIELFHEYQDIFAWGHEDLKGIPSTLAEHTIHLVPNATPVQQRRYRMNPNYAERVKAELDKLLKAKFISPVDAAPWLSPMVIIPKKNGTLRICVDFRKLNAATKKDHYPLPYMEEIIDEVAGHEMYSFLDCFSGYYQVAMAE